MQIRILNGKGDMLLTTKPVAEPTDRLKHMTSKEINAEFNKLIAEGYTAIDDDTDTIIRGITEKTDSVTMIFPLIGG